MLHGNPWQWISLHRLCLYLVDVNVAPKLVRVGAREAVKVGSFVDRIFTERKWSLYLSHVSIKSPFILDLERPSAVYTSSLAHCLTWTLCLTTFSTHQLPTSAPLRVCSRSLSVCTYATFLCDNMCVLYEAFVTGHICVWVSVANL